MMTNGFTLLIKKLRSAAVLATLAGGAFLLLAAPTAGAATFTVSNTSDGGAGSLRQAIADANAAPGADQISFDGSFGSARTIVLTGGQLTITDGVTIAGPGASLLTVSGNNLSRVFEIQHAATPVTISGMKITGGRAGQGAGVFNGRELTLDRVVVAGNQAVVSPARGGGIYNQGTLTITNSTVSGNYAADGCAGCYDNNSGGGVFSSGQLNITAVIIDGNSTTNRGGGIFLPENGGPAVITDSTISNNSVSGQGFAREGGGIFAYVPFTLTHSTVSGNYAFNGSGGISVNQVTSWPATQINTSTIVSNRTDNNGGGVSVGGCLNYNTNRCGSLVLTDSTVAFNSGGGSMGGGGIYNVSPHCTLNNSIVAGNYHSAGTGHDIYSYLLFNNNAPFSGSYNLIGTGDGAVGLANGTNNNQIGTNAAVINAGIVAAGLQFNGGATKTVALRPGSPAIDRGNATGTDQRGFRRGFDFPAIGNTGNGADIGAFEAGPVGVNSLLDTTDPTGGDGICGDGTTCTLRAALVEALAMGAGEIVFAVEASEMQILELGTALPVIPAGKTIAVVGPGADKLTVRRRAAAADFSVFETGGKTTISGLTISGGRAASTRWSNTASIAGGGGVLNYGELTLDRVVIAGNTAAAVPGALAAGGGVLNLHPGKITVRASTIANNRVLGGGRGGGFYNDSSLNISLNNTTVSGNHAAGPGGGGGGVYGTLDLLNTTVAFNKSDAAGGGLWKGGGFVFLKNSIVAENQAASAPDISGSLFSLGHNLIENRDGMSGSNVTDLPAGTDPRLNPALVPNAAATLGHEPLPDSPVIDQGRWGTSDPATDQRGRPRVVDIAHRPNHREHGDGTDIGAIEVDDFDLLIVNKTADTADGSCDVMDCSLREAIAAANATAGNEVIDFSLAPNAPGCDPASGVCTIVLTLGTEIVVSNAGGALTINGPGADRLVIDGGAGQNRILRSDAELTVRGVALQNGNGSGGGAIRLGGAILATGGALALDAVVVQNNTTPSEGLTGGSGGGVYIMGGTGHRIVNSTFAGNWANFSCAGFGIGASGASLYVINTTVTGNSTNFGDGSGFCVSSGAVVSARNATVVNNGGRGAIYVAGHLDISDSVVAGNAGSIPDIRLFVYGTLTSGGGNFIGDNNTVAAQFPAGAPNAGGEYAGTGAAPLAARLAPLGSYGGTTPTRPPTNSSAVLGLGRNNGFAAPPTDQRGVLRAGNSDSGAFQLNAPVRSALAPARYGSGYYRLISSDSGNFIYTITAGVLPPGLSLTTSLAAAGAGDAAPASVVAISGTPTTAGTYDFQITATDGSSSTTTDYQMAVQAAPTAAGVTAGGRVTTADGRGIRGVTVTMTDAQGATRTALTSTFGHYRFDDVEAGQTYVFAVAAKRYGFSRPAQALPVLENTGGIDFIADN